MFASYGNQGDTLFGTELQDKAIKTTDLGNTSIEFVLEDNLTEKFNKLGVEAELQVSLLAGMVELKGSGSYLGEQRHSARAQSISLLYKSRTVNQKVMIRHHKEVIDMGILSPREGKVVKATHVVYAIDWGAVCTVTCTYENKEDEDVTDVKGALSAELEKLKGKIDFEGSASAKYDDKDKEIHKKFTFKCHADVSAPGEDLPVTFEGAVELARKIPGLVKGTNKGKGVQLTYMLIPLQDIVDMCEHEIQIQTLYRAIDEDIIMKCGQIKERITKKKQQLMIRHRDLHDNEDFVAEESLLRIEEIFQKFELEELKFKARLQKSLMKVRSKEEEVSFLAEFLQIEEDSYFVSKFNDRGFEKDLNKVKSIKSWKNKGIIYLGRKDNLTVDDEKHVFVFYKTADEDDKDNHDKNQAFFLRLQKKHAQDGKNYDFIVVDQEVRHDLWPAGKLKASVHTFLDGTLISEDQKTKGIISIDDNIRKKCAQVEEEITKKYPEDILAVELSQPRAVQEKNILILGETGVGKSTRINGFINYKYFANLEEAINSK
ncbi:uncharacterized protein [Amphiura filiformis]|uniref:uncharacterized protein n=1 Tax=Amphiura filiformis TaxID=82378 RepID=UPI003B211519